MSAETKQREKMGGARKAEGPTTAKHRDKIVRAAALLFRRQGYAATGTNDIVTLSRAPKGSLYHYFPDGKAQIAEEAVRYASGLVQASLTALLADHANPAAALRAYGRKLVGWLAESDYRDGCPISTVLLELAPEVAGVTAAGRHGLGGWASLFAAGLAAKGVAAARADSLGLAAVAAILGALTLARVEQSGRPILAATEEMAALFEAAMAGRV